MISVKKNIVLSVAELLCLVDMQLRFVLLDYI
jgi:hypothetical protein